MKGFKLLFSLVTLHLALSTVLSAQWLDTTITVGANPFAFCYNSQNDWVYCACWGSDTVFVFDGATNAAIATIAVGDGPAGTLLQFNEQQGLRRERAEPYGERN